MRTIYEAIHAQLKNDYNLCYIDYRDSVSAKIVAECIERKSLDALTEEDCWVQQQYDAAVSELDYIGLSMYSKWEWERFKEEGSEYYDELLDTIRCNDSSFPEKDCWMQTRVNGRVLLFSNYDCWVPPYDAGGLDAFHDYLETAMRVLCLNPKKVKEVCSEWTICRGRWPNYPWRDGKEVVSYEGFSKILRESCSYGLLCFVGKMNMSELWDKIDKQDELVIPKGTTVTMFNHWNGGGSMDDCKTLRDVSLGEMNRRAQKCLAGTEYDFVELEVDERGCCRGYSTREVYGGNLSDDDLF